ncbi:MAG: hypothetical protein U9N11_03105, partial [Campylobacterota bacterium]|nr:hypothetical protein [Campylobacterota bacterium]
MKTIILFLSVFTAVLYAGFMDGVEDIVKSTLSSDRLEETKELTSVRTLPSVGGISSNKDKKDENILDSLVKRVESVKKESFLEKSLTAVKEVTGMKKVKEDNSYFDGGILGDIADMIELEKGDTLGLPSVLGLNKKTKTKVFGSTILGDTLLGDVKDTGTNFYRGFKTSGESTEFMSGVMYKSSKMYNDMFNMYDDSPFNVFESD